MPRTERELINRALEGDQKAFQVLFGKYSHRVYRMVSSWAADCDEADDLVQVTFVRAFRSLESYRGDAAFSTWLTRIAFNVCHSHAQAQKTEREKAEAVAGREEFACFPWTLRETCTPEQEVLLKEQRALVQKSIRALPVHYRNAMWLRYVQDRSYREIGRELAIPMGTVKTLLCRGRRRLKGEFLKLGVE